MSMWLTLSLVACTEGEPPVGDTAVSRSAIPLPEVQGGVWMAPVTEVAHPAPAWMASDLPRMPQDLMDAPHQWASWGTYAQRVCDGIDTTRSRWRLRLISSTGAAWSSLVDGCRQPSLCAWLDRHASEASEALPYGLATAVDRCTAHEPSQPWFVGERDLPAVLWPWWRDGAVDHDATLATLAAFAGLRRVAIRAVAPPPTVPRPAAYLALYAWQDGARIRTLTYPDGLAAQLTSHVGLINVLLARRDSLDRVAAVAHADQYWVVRAPARRIDELQDDDRLDWVPPDAGRALPPAAHPLPDAFDTGFPLIGGSTTP